MLVLLSTIIVGLFAVAGATNAASAFILLHFFESKTISTTLISVLFIATIIVNYRMCKYAVQEILIDMFGSGGLFKGLMQTEEGKTLTWKKKILMVIGVLLACSAGSAFSALNYHGTLVVMDSFSIPQFILNISHEIAFVFSLVMFICLSSLMLRSLSKLIKTENVYKKSQLVFYRLIGVNSNLSDKKKDIKLISKQIGMLLLTITSLLLAMLGLLMIMRACNVQLSAILAKNSHMTPHLAHVIANRISFGFAMVGQIPFVVRTTILTIIKFFNKNNSDKRIKTPVPSTKFKKTYVTNTSFFIMRLIYALGNSFISMLGAQGALLMILAGAGSFGYSFAASVPDRGRIGKNRSKSNHQL